MESLRRDLSEVDVGEVTARLVDRAQDLATHYQLGPRLEHSLTAVVLTSALLCHEDTAQRPFYLA